MLPRDQIEEAVDIQQRSYRLLRWMASAIDRGFIGFSRAHDYSTASDAARDWIREHFDNLPPDARPVPGRLQAFSNFFGSYVTTSFDLVEQPGRKLVSACGCYCPLCARLAQASHLRTKSLAKRDKVHAQRKCVDRVMMLAGEEQIPLEREQAEAITADAKLSRAAAYSAYGLSLLERVRGSDGGLHILALWRMLAWKPEGSPIKDFVLEADAICEAERRLVAGMRTL